MIVACQVGTDDLPARSVVCRAVNDVRADVQGCGIMRGNLDGKGPLEPIFERFGTGSHAVHFWPDRNVALLAGLGMPGNQATVPGAGADAATKDQMRWIRANRDVAALAAARLDMVLPRDRALEIDAPQAHGPV